MRRLLAIALSLVTALAVALPAHAVPTTEQRTERLFVSAGCPQDTPGTCTSTRWLGKTPGDSSSNFVTAITPVDEALFRATGQINWRDYPADSSARSEGYRLIGGTPVTASVTTTAQGVGINQTIHARLSGQDAASAFGRVTFPAQSKTILTQAAGTTTTTFTWTVPAELDGIVMKAPLFEVAVHGVNAAAGYIDQQGGSTVTIPHLVAIT